MSAAADIADVPGVGYFDYVRASNYTSLSVTTLRGFASRGMLPTKRVGTRVLVTRGDLDALIERLQTTPGNGRRLRRARASG